MKIIASIVVLSLAITVNMSCSSAGSRKEENDSLPVEVAANGVKYQLVTDAIQTPVQMVTANDNTDRLFILDLSGRVLILKNGQLSPRPFIDVSSKLEQKDTAAAMRAIFSMAFHPDFANNRKFYICYNAPSSNAKDKCKLMISEFKASNSDPDQADLSSGRKVFEADGSTIGVDDCQIAFGPDGYLYIAVGDNGTAFEQREGQNLQSFLGKLLRIDVNKTPYAIPADNPFAGRKKVRPEIWSYGLRRLWRFSFDPKTQLLFGADVGDKMAEEIDIIQKGGNYGWPIKEGDSLAVKNTTADTASFIAPLNSYSHQDGICVIGGSMYYGNELPYLKDKYVFADLNGNLFSLTKNSSGNWSREQLKLLNPPADAFTIFSFDKDKHNELFVMGVLNTRSGSKGAIYKLVHG
jgi:glucose/arabinose dehydrogenase